MTHKYKKPRTSTMPSRRPKARPTPKSRTHKPEPRTPPQLLAPLPKAKREFDSLAVGDRKQKHRVSTEVFARSPVCENFEAEVKKAARQVAEADKAVGAAEAHVEKVEAAAGTARAKRAKANGNRIAKLWRLGDWLERWEKEFGDHKRRGPDTFYAKAKKACGNKDVFYRARDIRGPFGYVTEEAACKAGETEPLRTILERIKLLKREAKSGVTATTDANSTVGEMTTHPESGRGNTPGTPTTANGTPRISANPDLQDTETPPSLCQWIYERFAETGASPQRILDPCAGRGNMTIPFRPRSRIIEYEILVGRDFFAAKKIACDLVLCNPRWSEAEPWLRHIVKVVGKCTPLVFICPMLFFSGYKSAPVRKYLELAEAPHLDHVTPLPKDTFVDVYELGVILWFNLPSVRNVAFVPSTYLIRSNEPFDSDAEAVVEGHRRLSDEALAHVSESFDKVFVEV